MTDYVANLFLDSPHQTPSRHRCFAFTMPLTFVRQLYDGLTQPCWDDGAKPLEDAAIAHTELLLYVV